MPRPRFKIRELMVIGVPTAIIIAGAAFLSRQQTIREQDRSGPYRAEITRIEILPVSPFEAWQGFDTKIVVYANEFGELDVPLGARLSPAGSLRQKVTLVGQIKGQQKSFAVASQGWGGLYEPEHVGILRAIMVPAPAQIYSDVPRNCITFLASTSRLDPKSPLQLRGDIWFERTATPQSLATTLASSWKPTFRSGHLAFLTARSKSASLAQSLERTVSVNVSRIPFPVNQTHVDLLSPSYAHTDITGDGRSGYVTVFFKLTPELRAMVGVTRLRCTQARVFDAQGSEVHLNDLQGRPVIKKAEWSREGGVDVALIKLPLESVPLWRGQLTLKMWLAVGDNWPMKIQTIVRPAWMSRLPKKLKLQSIKVEKGNVTARVRYAGGKLLEWGNGRRAREGEMQGVFDSRHWVTPYLPPHQAGYDRMFPFWSQHFSMPNGGIYWLRSNVNLSSVSCDVTNNCQITYKTSALKALKSGQSARFAAQIGLDGDGFLPIQATITRPK